MREIPEHLQERLETAAFRESVPYCYACRAGAPEGRCPRCGSDDLMRHLEGVGVEYGTEWVVAHLLESNLRPADTEAAFEESLREVYDGTTRVGFIEVDTVDAIKRLDPISFELAESEWIGSELEDGLLLTPDGATYYWTADVERYLEALGV